MKQLKALSTTDTVASRYDDGGSAKVNLALGNVAVDDLNDKVLIMNEVSHRMVDHLALVVSFVNLLLHHTRAYCRHLWTMLRVDNGCHDVATESWADLVKEVLELLVLVCIVADLQRGTVSS